MNVVVSTYDKNLFLIPGFAYLFNKYWDAHQTLTVIGFRPPIGVLPSNVKFEAMAPAETRAWTDHHGDWLRRTPFDKFVFLLDDYWLINPIRRDVITRLYDEVGAGADKAELNADMYGKHNTKHGFTPEPYKRGLVQSPRGSRYRTSLQPAIWTREFMLSLMVEGRSPWEFEMEGDDLTRGARVIAPTRVSPKPYPMANICHLGNIDRGAVRRIAREDRIQLAKLRYDEVFNAPR